MGLYCTVSEIDGDFSRKSQKIRPLVFCAPLNGFPLKLFLGAGVKKLEWWGYRADKEVWRYFQPSGQNARTWQTDGQTDRHRATSKNALTHSVEPWKLGRPHGNNSAEYVYCAYDSINNWTVMRSAKAGSRDLFRFSDASVFLERVEPDSFHGWITTGNYWRMDNNKRGFHSRNSFRNFVPPLYLWTW